MTIPALTTAQRAIVRSEARHLLVEAGAGTGKTTTVVRAICHRLGLTVAGVPGAPEPVPLDAVVAITFTTMAAADLQRKLRAALRAAGRRDLAAAVDEARVGTIHGFCGDLLREHGPAAGIRVGARVLSDGESAALSEACAREAVAAALEANDCAGLDALLAGRRVREVFGMVAALAADADRLARWRAAAAHRPHEVAALELAARAVARRHERLAADGALDFDRMLTAVRDLLRDHPAVRHAVQRGTRLLVIDEFQDVDPVQREIAELLGGLAEAGDPAPSSLLLVGDPKQSIYRFRRADVTVWNGVAAAFRGAADAAVVPLDDNFRSVPAVLACVDQLLRPRFDTPVAGEQRQPYEVPYRALRPTRVANDSVALECWCVPPRDNGAARSADEVRAIEAAAIAARVRAMVDRGRSPGEIAIVVASWGAAPLYAGALRAAGVPVHLLKEGGFWEAREVVDCLLALRVIRDPTDDVALCGFLKGPMVGVRDDTLLALARARRPAESWWDALPRVAVERDRLDGARGLIRQFAGWRDRVGVGELLRRLLEATGYIAHVASLGDGATQGVANLRKLVRLADAAGHRPLGAVLREVADARARGDREPHEPLVRGQGDAVTIVSVHGAKGLEWPVVIWADLVRTPRAEQGSPIVLRDRVVIARAGDEKDAEHAAARKAVALEQQAERWRLWYVAMTRARDLLVLSGIPMGEWARGEGTPAMAVREALGLVPGVGEVLVRGADESEHCMRVVMCDLVPEPVAAPPLREVPLAVVPPAVPVRPPRRVSPTALAERARSAREREAVRRAGATVAGKGALARGQAVHAALERYDPEGVPVERVVALAVERWLGQAGSESPDAELVRAAVEAAVAHPRWREVASLPGAARELPFTWFPGGDVVVQGVVDLIGWDGGEARVCDVKMTDVAAAAAAARYAVQASAYVGAVRAITGHAATFELLLVPAGEVVPVAAQVEVVALARGE